MDYLLATALGVTYLYCFISAVELAGSFTPGKKGSHVKASSENKKETKATGAKTESI